MVAVPAPSSARPAKGVAFKDPACGTCVVRATNHNTEPPSGFARNDYSRRQAFNVDNSRFLAYAYDGAWHLYDANTLAHIREQDGPGGDAEPQWRSEEHTSDLQSLMRISYAVFCLTKKKPRTNTTQST